MKKLLRNFALVAVAVASAVSCSESGVNDDINHSLEGVTLYATTPSGDSSTKVSFSDEGDQGIALKWEAGDKFVLYDSEGTEIDTFITEAGDGAFESNDDKLTLDKGETYTAKFNGNATTAEQNGDEINNLRKACQMEATFTYGDDFKIAFAHTKAIMTFTFKSEERPAKLIFENGDEATYTVNYSAIEPVEGLYTSHIMIDPCDETKRELKFTLYNSTNTPYDIRTVEGSIAYKKGYRYTAPISDIVKFSGGAGTVDDPYKISCRADFDELSADTNGGSSYSGKFFVMTNDVELGGESNEFTAIGNYSNTTLFRGTFDGAGHAVTGLYINQPKASCQGLFGAISLATIKNLSVSGEVTGIGVGGVVGYTEENSTITNCCNSCSLKGGDGVNTYIGGVVGIAYNTIITNCYNSGSLEGSSGAYVGGVVGVAYRSTTTNNCYNSGSVNGEHCGGVVGLAYNTITNCYWDEAKCTEGIGCDGGVTLNNVEGMTADEMQAETFVTTLNKNAKAIEGACGWRERYSDFPILLFGSDPNGQLEGIGNGNHVLK